MHAVIAQRTIAVRRTSIVCRTHLATAHAAARCAGMPPSCHSVCMHSSWHVSLNSINPTRMCRPDSSFHLSRLQHRVPAFSSPSQNVVRQAAIQSVRGSRFSCRAAAASPTAAPGDFVEVPLCHVATAAFLAADQSGLFWHSTQLHGAAVQALQVHLRIQLDMRWFNRCTTLAGWRAARCLTRRGSASRCPSR